MKRAFLTTALLVITLTQLMAGIVFRGFEKEMDPGANPTNRIIKYKFNYKNDIFTFKDIDREEFAKYNFDVKQIPYQLPENLLPEFSIKELLCYCIDHPKLSIFEMSQYKYEDLSVFNGFNEILRRPNFFEEVIKICQENLQTGLTYELDASDFFYLPSFYSRLDNNQKRQVLDLLIEALSRESDSGLWVPRAGKIRHFLRHAYPDEVGQWMSGLDQSRGPSMIDMTYASKSDLIKFQSKIKKLN